VLHPLPRASSGSGTDVATGRSAVRLGPLRARRTIGPGQGGRKGFVHEIRECPANSAGRIHRSSTTDCGIARTDARVSARDPPETRRARCRAGQLPGAGGTVRGRGSADIRKRPEELRLPQRSPLHPLQATGGSSRQPPRCKHLVSYRWPMQAPTGSRVVRSPSGQDPMYGRDPGTGRDLSTTFRDRGPIPEVPSTARPR